MPPRSVRRNSPRAPSTRSGPARERRKRRAGPPCAIRNPPHSVAVSGPIAERRAHEGPALRRGEEEARRGPFDNEQTGVARGARPLTAHRAGGEGTTLMTPTAHVMPVCGTPCWVNLMTRNLRVTQDFYSAVLGWEFRPGSLGTGFSVAFAHGRPVAGMGEVAGGRPVAGSWTPYFAVADADATAARVRERGGTVAVGPVRFPWVGARWQPTATGPSSASGKAGPFAGRTSTATHRPFSNCAPGTRSTPPSSTHRSSTGPPANPAAARSPMPTRTTPSPCGRSRTPWPPCGEAASGNLPTPRAATLARALPGRRRGTGHRRRTRGRRNRHSPGSVPGRRDRVRHQRPRWRSLHRLHRIGAGRAGDQERPIRTRRMIIGSAFAQQDCLGKVSEDDTARTGAWHRTHTTPRSAVRPAARSLRLERPER